MVIDQEYHHIVHMIRLHFYFFVAGNVNGSALDSLALISDSGFPVQSLNVSSCQGIPGMSVVSPLQMFLFPPTKKGLFIEFIICKWLHLTFMGYSRDRNQSLKDPVLSGITFLFSEF